MANGFQLERKNPPTPKTESPEAKSPFQNLSSPQNLENLNSHLQSHSYIDGYTPNHLDLLVHGSVPKPVLSSYPHINRWYHHIIAIQSSIQVTWLCLITGFECRSMNWFSHTPLEAACLLSDIPNQYYRAK